MMVMTDQQRLAAAAMLAREFVRAPLDTASVVPSSPALCRLLAAPVPQAGDPVVVELGPGTGVVTAVLQDRLAGRGRHLAVEINPRFVDPLRARFPHVEVLCGDARAVPAMLADRGLAADVVVSALPWAAFRVPGPVSLPEQLGGAMVRDGTFVQLALAPTRWASPARTQRAELRAAFEEVVTSSTVWRNAPPAFVYLARRPRNGRRAQCSCAGHRSVNADEPVRNDGPVRQ